MADNSNADSLQIEIVASSAEAEKRIDALTASLERLKAASNGLRNVSDKIRGIGESARGTAGSKTRQRNDALKRATEQIRIASASPEIDTLKISKNMRSLDSEIERVKNTTAELEQQLSILSNVKGSDAYTDQISALNRQLLEQQTILEGLISKRERLSKTLVKGTDGPEDSEKEIVESEDSFQKKIGIIQRIKESINSIKPAKLTDAEKLIKATSQLDIIRVKANDLKQKIQDALNAGDTGKATELVGKYKQIEEQIKKSSSAWSNFLYIGKQAVSSITPFLSEIKKALDETNSKILSTESLWTKLGELASSVMGDIKNAAGEAADSIKEKFSGAFSQTREKLNEFKEKASETMGKISGGKAVKSTFATVAQPIVGAASLIGKAFSKIPFGLIKNGFESALGAGKKLVKLSFSGLKNGIKAVASGAKNLASAMAKVAKIGFTKAISGLKLIGSSVIGSITRPFTSAIEKVSKWKQMLGSALFYSMVFKGMSLISSGMKEGIDNLYQYSMIIGTDFAPAMDSLATSMLYLKNSIGAMVAPLIQAVAPAVQFLTQKFVELTTAIGKAFAALTGKKTFTQAVRVPKQYAEAATGAAKASDKAKKATDDYAEALQNFSIGIDELNVIEPPDTGSKLKDTLKDLDDLGNGAGGIDYGSMFEEVEIPVETLDWANQIREAIENGDWYSVGSIVAEKLNEIVDGWDSYGWGETLGGAITNGLNVALGFLENFSFAGLGSKIADWFNGLADGLEWETLGNVIAEKYNALFDFVYGFATSLNWARIGTDISDALNGFLDQIDPEKSAAAVNAFILGIFTAFDNIITGTSWDTLGTKLATAFNNIKWNEIVSSVLTTAIDALFAFKTSIDAFLENWNWEDMATQIYTAINDTFVNVDWNGLGATLGNLISTVIQFAGTFLNGLNFSEIGQSIGNIVNGFFANINWSDAGATVSRGITSIFDTLFGFIGILDWASIGQSIKEFLIGGFSNAEQWLTSINWRDVGKNAWKEFKRAIEGLDFAEIAKSFFRLFGTSLGSFASILSSFISGVIDDIEDYFSQYIEDAKDKWGDNGAAIILGVLKGIKDALVGIVMWVKENIFDPFINAFKDAFGIHSPSTVMKGYGENIMQGAINGVGEKIGEFIDKVKEAFNGVVNFLNDVFSGNWGAALETISTLASDIFNGIIDFLNDTFKGDWESAWDSVANVFKGVWNEMIGIVEGAANKIIGGVNWLINGLNKIGIDIPDFLGGGTIGFDIPQIPEIQLPRLASGGILDSGQMFIARENGPELVGNIGKKTAVVNNDQIISGISQGVENANEEQNALLREQNELLRALLQKDTTVRIGNKDIKQAYDMASRQSGASIMAGGVMV